MNWRGYKLHCLCVLVALGFVEQLSWHHLPIWLLPLAAPVWSTRSFLPLAILQILTWTLPSFLGIKGSLYFPHPLPTQHASVPGMNPMLVQPTSCYWLWLKMNKPGLAYWQCHVQSGAWLNALPIAPLGLRLSDDVIRVAVGLRLGVPICRPHLCVSCGANVEALGVHGLSCCFSKGRHSRHAALNDILKRTLESAKIPCHFKPSGLSFGW